MKRAGITIYLAVWAVTLLGALATALVGGSLTRMVRASFGLTLSAARNPPPG